MPSSTSSSDPRSGVPRVGVPWALLGALALVGLLDLGVRAVEPRALLPYDYGEDEYYAAAGHLEAYGPAEICVVGSSRAKEAIVAPQLAEELGVSVRNYACAGARADETRALVDELLRQGTPQWILCGVSPRILLDRERRWARAAIFWDWADWRQAARTDRRDALRVLPVVVRRTLGKFWRTLHFRQKPAVLVDDAWIYYEAHRDHGLRLNLWEFLAGQARPSPLNGELTERQRDLATRSLVTDPVPEERVREYVERLLTNGEYVLGEVRREELQGMIKACAERGVRLLFFEVPVSELLEQQLPPAVHPAFQAHMQALTDGTTAAYLPADSLGIALGPEDFAEQSHLNLRGAEKLTGALAARLRP